LKEKTIGLALSGGGARGIAHVGVIAALEEADIFPTVMSGASAGSIVGAMYSAGITPLKMLDIFKSASILKTISLEWNFSGMTNLDYLQDLLSENISYDSFERLFTPLYIAVTNMNKGTLEIISEGTLFDVVTASSSIPFVFNPVKLNEDHYSDGGLMMNLPARPIRPMCDILIGVNVMPHIEVPQKKINNAVEIAMRTSDLIIWNNSQADLAVCDEVIEPSKLSKINIFSFHKAQELYDIGYEAAKGQVECIQELVLS